MGDLFLLSVRQLARISPCILLSHGVPRVDAWRVLSSIVYVIRVFSGRTRRLATGRARRSTIASYLGAASACSTASSPGLPEKGRSRTASRSTRRI